eukprot:107630-Chlamydomonas_euryale.AAC.1
MGSVRFHLRADAHAAGADYADLADPISEAMQKDLTAFIERLVFCVVKLAAFRGLPVGSRRASADHP